MKLYIIFIIIICILFLYQNNKKENLSNSQLLIMKKIDYKNSLRDNLNNAQIEFEIAKVMENNDGVNCYISINELDNNGTVICESKYSPFISKEKCISLGKEFNTPSYNIAQNTRCLIDINNKKA